MKTYIVTSWVDRPSIVEADNVRHARDIYAYQLGYTSWDVLANAVGPKFAAITVEELCKHENKHSEPGTIKVRTF